MFAKRSGKSKNARKKPSSGEDDGADAGTGAALQAAAAAAAERKPTAGLSHSSAKSDKLQTGVQHESTRLMASAGPQDGGATRTNHTETEEHLDARAIAERHEAAQAMYNNDEANGAGKTYQGMNNYKDYITKKEPGVNTNKATAKGPLRQSAHIRMTNVFDYQPNICKDYKETGFCGYGDSCKFMHDRGDYLQGWQIENAWQAEQKKKRKALEEEEERRDEELDDGAAADKDGKGGAAGGGGRADNMADDLPFACLLCRQPFVNAVVTKCKHYFCESCALKQYGKSKKCFACSAETWGMFNAAQELRSRERRRQAAEAEAETKRVAGNAAKADDDEDDDQGERKKAKFASTSGWSFPSASN